MRRRKSENDARRVADAPKNGQSGEMAKKKRTARDGKLEREKGKGGEWGTGGERRGRGSFDDDAGVETNESDGTPKQKKEGPKAARNAGRGRQLGHKEEPVESRRGSRPLRKERGNENA